MIEAGQRWQWREIDSVGQRLVVEIISVQSAKTARAKILQRYKISEVLIIGNEFTMILSGWELLEGQEKC